MAASRDERGLPPPPLNKQPLGLLDFLQIKNGGQNPQRLVTDLVPTWDLRDHYLQTNATLSETTGIAVATGDNSYVELIAARDFWRWCNFLSWSFVPLNAVDLFQGFLGQRYPGLNNLVMLPFEPYTTSSGGTIWSSPAGAVLRPYYGTSEGFWIPPGVSTGLIQLTAVSTGGLATLRRISSLSDFRA